jgi:signal transduction histidine kinase
MTIISPAAVIFSPRTFDMQSSLRHQILIPFAALLALAVLGLTLLNAYLGARRVTHETEYQLRQVARTLLESRFPLTDRVLQQMHGLTGAHFLITSAGGEVQATSAENADMPLPPDAAKDRWQDLSLNDAPVTADEQHFALALRIHRRDPAAEPVVLHILYPVRSFREARWAAVFPSLFFGVAVLIVAIVLSFWISQRLSQPIRRIGAHVGQLASGNFIHLDAPGGPVEISELVLSINRLSTELLNMRDAIGRRERLALLGQLSAGLVHHLRNDVTGTRIALQLHQRSCDAGDQESLDVALRQLTLTEEHLKSFLAVGQPLHVEKQACDLIALVEDISRLVGPTLKHRRIRFTLRADKGPFILPLDVVQFRQALVALLLNAMDAVEQGGAIELRIDCDSSANVRVSVCDTGSGPRSDLAERIFEPLFTTKPEGVGLGLTAARNIAVAHGGSLEFFRNDHQTVFQLVLPSPPLVELQREGALTA